MITERWFTSSETLRWPRWRGALALLGVILLLAACGASTTVALRFDRLAIEHGQWYRLLTGHFVHLGWKHTLLNGAGVLLLPLIAPEEKRWLPWLFQLLVLCVGISALLLLRQPQLEWYVGLSGVLHGLYFLAIVRLAREQDLIARAVLLILVGKVVWEHYHGPLQFSQAVLDQPVIVAAHSYGIGVAMVYAIVAAAIAKFSKSRQ